MIDTVTNTVIARPIIDTIDYRYFPEGYEHEAGFPTDLEVSDDGSRIYIARGDDIVVVEAATNSVVGEIPVATNIPNDGAQSLTITEVGAITSHLRTLSLPSTSPPRKLSRALRSQGRIRAQGRCRWRLPWIRLQLQRCLRPR